jgi:hypothetical protein
MICNSALAYCLLTRSFRLRAPLRGALFLPVLRGLVERRLPGTAWLHARLRSRWQAAKMHENTAIAQPQETSFLVWSAARPIGVAHKSADGGIVVKLDAGEVVKSDNMFTLYPVR